MSKNAWTCQKQASRARSVQVVSKIDYLLKKTNYFSNWLLVLKKTWIIVKCARSFDVKGLDVKNLLIMHKVFLVVSKNGWIGRKLINQLK